MYQIAAYVLLSLSLSFAGAGGGLLLLASSSPVLESRALLAFALGLVTVTGTLILELGGAFASGDDH